MGWLDRFFGFNKEDEPYSKYHKVEDYITCWEILSQKDAMYQLRKTTVGEYMHEDNGDCIFLETAKGQNYTKWVDKSKIQHKNDNIYFRDKLCFTDVDDIEMSNLRY